MSFSVVIITKNEAHIIAKTLESIKNVSNDIVIVDSGSTDDTIAICKKFNTTVIETSWYGYGVNKNKGIDAAKHDWVLSLDADEVLDEQLQQSLKQLNFSQENAVYNLKFKTFFCNKLIKHGEWSGDEHIRLFNKKNVRWNDVAVHENLQIEKRAKVITLKGFIHHFTIGSIEEYIHKTITYAKLNAEKYYKKQKKASLIKLLVAPKFSFLKHYFFKLGFLDGREGYFIAKTNAWYIFLKYAYLKNMYKNK